MIAGNMSGDNPDIVANSWEDIEDYVAFEWTTRGESDLTDSKNNNGCGCLVTILSIALLVLFVVGKYL